MTPEEQKLLAQLLKSNNKILSSEIRKIVREEMDFLVSALSKVIKQNQTLTEATDVSYQNKYDVKSRMDAMFSDMLDDGIPENQPPIPFTKNASKLKTEQAEPSFNPDIFLYHNENGSVVDVSRQPGASAVIKKVFKDYSSVI